MLADVVGDDTEGASVAVFGAFVAATAAVERVAKVFRNRNLARAMKG
jgi:hypothetical protein